MTFRDRERETGRERKRERERERFSVFITYAETYTVTPPISTDNAFYLYTLWHFNVYFLYVYNYI